jgi:CBS domain containing-hemolysin-like protein
VTPLLLFLLGCVVIYIATVQAAFAALLRLSLRLLAERNGRSDLLGRFLDDPIQLFIPVRLLLGIAFALATILVASMLGVAAAQSLSAAMLAMVAFVLVCEHLVPLLIVHRDPERVMDLLLPTFAPVVRIMQPVTNVLVGLIAPRRERHPAVAPVPDAAQEDGAVTEAYLEVAEHQGLIEREERKLLQSIFDFGDTLVREVMTPRPDVVAIRDDATLDELRALFQEQEYSRIPVYRESLDNIVGIVFVKDLIRLAGMGGTERPISNLVRPAYFVPETKRVAELLKEFQGRQVQLAIVVDEYGGTAGLVTLEDLLEEIVGEIRDEYDVESESVVDEGNGAFIFSGKTDIHELMDRLDVEVAREGFETVGGFLLARLGRVPTVGETFEIDGLVVEVLEAERRRVHKVRVRRKLQPVEATAGRHA